MKTALLVLSLMLNAGLVYEGLKLKNTVADITQELEIQVIRTKAVEQNAIDSAHSVQDAVEERIGTLERKVDDLEFLFGSTLTKKGRK